MDKSFLYSKTFWFNCGLLLFSFLVDLPTELKELGVPEEYALRFATVGNMGLRFLTAARVTFSLK